MGRVISPFTGKYTEDVQPQDLSQIGEIGVPDLTVEIKSSRQPLTTATINTQHPLYANMQYCVIASQTTEMVNSYTLNFKGNAAKVWQGDYYTLDFDGTDDAVEIASTTGENYATDGQISVVIGFKGFAQGTLMAKRDATEADRNWQVFFSAVNNAQAGFGAGNDTYTFNAITPSATQRVIGLSHQDNDTRLYWDGVLSDTSTSVVDNATNAYTVLLGARWDNYAGGTLDFEYMGSIEFAYVWYGRYLTADEHSSIAAQPYQFVTQDTVNPGGSVFAGVFRGVGT